MTLQKNRKAQKKTKEDTYKMMFDDIANIRCDLEKVYVEPTKYEAGRLIAHGILSKCIDDCAEGICPPVDLLIDGHDLLTNLSLDYYCQLQIWFDGENGTGNNHAERAESVRRKIQTVLDCNAAPSMPTDFFTPFVSKIKNDNYIAKGIRNRKAFWTYLKYSPSNNPVTDYAGAHYFVNQFHLNWDKVSENELNHLFADFGIINGFELFQRCIVKNKCQQKQSTLLCE